MKDNKKEALRLSKVSLQYVSPIALTHLALAMHEPAVTRYAPFNFRTGVKASDYYGATLRHMTAFFSGEDRDPETGVMHLAYAMANCSILIDAFEMGYLEDDRPFCTDDSVRVQRAANQTLKDAKEKHKKGSS